ncbi:MAG TPA: hypothetical protein VGK38_03615, partial [Prolixibacteraceae bacterium]
AASLYAIWQEADYINGVQNCPSAKSLITRLKLFVPTLKDEFFLKQNDTLHKLLDDLSGDVIHLGKEGATPNFVARIKVEITNLKKIVNRITVIKTTDFIPSVFVCIEAITIIFLAVYCLLAVDPWWGGLILVCIFTFVIFAILFLIKDMEDPFEYDGTGYSKSDEVSLEVLDNFQNEIEGKMV